MNFQKNNYELLEEVKKLDLVDMAILRALKIPKTVIQIAHELNLGLNVESIRKRVKNFLRMGLVEELNAGNPRFYKLVYNEIFEDFEKAHKIKFVDENAI